MSNPSSGLHLLAGGVLGRLGYYQAFLVVGAAIVTVGSGLIWMLNATGSAAKSAGYQVLTGIGDGICVQVPVTAVQAFVEPKDLASVTALELFLQLGSGVIGVAAGESIFSNRLPLSLSRYASGIAGEEVRGVGATQLEEFFSGETLHGAREAYLAGIKDAWILTLALCGAAFVVSCIAPPVSILGKTGIAGRKEKDQEDGKERQSKEVVV